MLLSLHAGGTPWEWRSRALEQDWATAVHLLNEQAELMNKQ